MRNWLIGLLGGITPAQAQSYDISNNSLGRQVAFLSGKVEAQADLMKATGEITEGILSGRFTEAEQLGIHFSHQSDEFQAQFFEGIAKGFGEYPNKFAQDMQTSYFTSKLSPEAKSVIEMFLSYVTVEGEGS